MYGTKDYVAVRSAKRRKRNPKKHLTWKDSAFDDTITAHDLKRKEK